MVLASDGDSMTRARYEWRATGSLLVIVDRCLPGTRTVTNDVEHVIAELHELVPDIASRRIIYRDTDGRWDGILLDARGQYAGFIAIGARNVISAMVAAQTMRWAR